MSDLRSAGPNSWIAFWATVVFLALLLVAGGWLLRQEREGVDALTCRRVEGGRRLSPVRDGPFVVTHLVFWAGGGPE